MEGALVIVALLLTLSVLGSKASGRLGVPAMLFFLALGMLAGQSGLGALRFVDLTLTQLVGVLALVFILYSGGLDTDWRRVRAVLREGVLLSTVGVLATALLTAAFARLLGFTFLEGVLLGAIISSTDAAAVFTVLRSREVRLKGELEPLLELEAGSNDPFAVFLTFGAIALIQAADVSIWTLAPMAVVQFALGGAAGFAIGYGAVRLINHIRLRFDGLYAVLTTAVVLFCYGATAMLGGNGFLAAYLCGLVMGRADFIHKNSLLRFHDSIAWLMQIVMFLLLGLLVSPQQLGMVAGKGLAVTAFLLLVARPASVLLVLAGSRFNLRERLLIAWVGLRGAAPIILATFPLLAGISKAEMIFNIVFFVVLVSVLLQGTTVLPVGRLLNLAAPPRARGNPNLTATYGVSTVVVPQRGAVAGQQIVDLRLPPEVIIVRVLRDGQTIVPHGGVELEEGDVVLLVGEPALLEQAKHVLEMRRANPFV